jgi:hypothetical protein
MTFSEIQTEILDRLNLSSPAAQTRVGRAINRIYREVGTAIGMSFMRQTATSKVVSIGNPEVIFTATEKVLRVWTLNDSSNPMMLDEVLFATLREDASPSSDDPKRWALKSTTSNSVTIRLDRTPATAFTLYADVIAEVTDLSGSNEPNFPESFHDVLVEGVLKDEYKKLEKPALARDSEDTFKRRMSDLRMFKAKSDYMLIRQGEDTRATSRIASGGTSSASIGTLPLTITAAWTFDRDPSAPFIVSSGSAVVTNLDADLLDGQHGSYYVDPVNHTFLHDGVGANSRTVRAKLRGIERSIMDYGADPANSAADNYTAITEALTATPAGGTLWIDAGQFNTNGPLIRNNDNLTYDEGSIHLRGHGKASVLRCMSNTNLLEFTADEGCHTTAWSMRDFLLTYDAGLSTGSAIYLRHWHRGLLENVYVAGAPTGGTGLRIAQCIVNTYINFVYGVGFDIGGAIAPTFPSYGILIEDYLGVASNANTFIGGEVFRADVGVYLTDSGRGNRFYGTVIESNTLGVQVSASHVDWVFDGIWLEGNGTQYNFANGQGIFRPNGDMAQRMSCTYRAKGISNATQEIATGAAENIVFQTNEYNVGYSGNIHALTNSTTQSRFVAPVNGLYTVTATVPWVANATGVRTAAIVKNDATNIAENTIVAGAASAISQQVTADALLAKDDYITISVVQNSGGNLNVSSGASCAFRWVAEEFIT